MLEFIKIINNDYAGVLSLLTSLVMVVITIIYVMHTKSQAYYAKESAELVAKQIKTDKQIKNTCVTQVLRPFIKHAQLCLI